MNNAELDALAKGLSMHQRHRLRAEEDGWQFGSRWLPASLALDSGVVSQAGWRETYRLTPLGLQLQSHLRAQEGSAGGERA